MTLSVAWRGMWAGCGNRFLPSVACVMVRRATVVHCMDFDILVDVMISSVT